MFRLSLLVLGFIAVSSTGCSTLNNTEKGALVGGGVGTVVGTATLTFADGHTATFASSVNGSAQTMQITRQLFAPPAGTLCR